MIFIGSVSIGNISGTGNVQFGNIVNRSPISSSKTTTGSGAENDGKLVITYSGFNQTTTSSPTPSGQTTSGPTTFGPVTIPTPTIPASPTEPRPTPITEASPTVLNR